MTTNQLPSLPEPDTHCFDDDTGKDVWSYTADQMHAYALAAIAQQAQEPVGYLPSWAVGRLAGELGGAADPVSWGIHAPIMVADCPHHVAIYTTQPAPQVPAPVDEAFAEGWRMAADWANRDDLLPDMDSPQYAKERDERLAELRPAVEPMTPEQREVLAALVVGACEHKTRTLLALRAIEATEDQYGIGITAKAEDAHQPTKEAGKAP